MSAESQQGQRHRLCVERIAKEILLAEHIELVNPNTPQISGLLRADLGVLTEQIDLPINLIAQGRRQFLLDVVEPANDLRGVRQSRLSPFVRQHFTGIQLCKP